MEDLANIDIEGKKLAVSAQDIRKLYNADGCQLQMVTDRVHNLDDSVESETDDYIQQEDGQEAISLQKDERVKREYLSLILNANRDPVKPSAKCRFRELQEEQDGECETNTLGDRNIGIHRMYENVGNYEDYMKKNSFEEVSPERVYKKKRVFGVELPVKQSSLVIYNCALWTEHSKDPFDSTWLRRSVITTNLATDSILPGLQELLLTTKKGEICEAFIRPQAAFGPLGAMPRIPPNATIFCLLEVVKVITEDKMSILARNPNTNDGGLTFEDFYMASDEARRRGNYYFDQEQYKTALQRYRSGIRLLEAVTLKNEQEEDRAKELLLKLYNNCARTANANGDPRLALAACKQASEINNMVPKTYWHRMTAWNKKGHLDRALGIARCAMQLFQDPKINKPFQRAAEELKFRIQKEKTDADNLHRLMGRALLTSTW